MPDLELLPVEREIVLVVEGELESVAVRELDHALPASMNFGKVDVAGLDCGTEIRLSTIDGDKSIQDYICLRKKNASTFSTRNAVQNN